MKQISSDIARSFRRAIDSASKVAIICHMTPDGDALGSSLCLCHTLRAAGLRADVVTPDAPPKNLMFLPGAQEMVTIASYHHERAYRIFSHADLVVCLDFNDLKRIDRAAPLVEGSSARRIVVDHHLNPAIEADLLVSDPSASSTCLLLFQLLYSAGLYESVGLEAATCCVAGMMTDTGNFAYNANDPVIYSSLGLLMERGVDKNSLYDRLFNTNSIARIRLMGYCQYAKTHILPEHSCAIITLSLDEAREFGYSKGDTEGLVNIPLSIPGVVYSIYLRQDEPEYVKVSMRSKGDFSVKELCETYFGGGGHHNAAGGEIHSDIDTAFRQILDILPVCDEELRRITEADK